MVKRVTKWACLVGKNPLCSCIETVGKPALHSSFPHCSQNRTRILTLVSTTNMIRPKMQQFMLGSLTLFKSSKLNQTCSTNRKCLHLKGTTIVIGPKMLDFLKVLATNFTLNTRSIKASFWIVEQCLKAAN